MDAAKALWPLATGNGHPVALLLDIEDGESAGGHFLYDTGLERLDDAGANKYAAWLQCIADMIQQLKDYFR
jgi:hypothetical protein